MLAISGGRVITVDRGDIEGGTVLVEGGKILAVAANLAIPSEAETVDVRGKYVVPGLIDGHTHVGIAEEAQGWAGMDVNEMTDPVTPHLRAVDAINPEDQGFKDALSGGVTAVMIAPGSANVIGGELAVLKTHGRTVADMTMRAPAGVKAALGENPKRVYGDQKLQQTDALMAASSGRRRRRCRGLPDGADQRLNKSAPPQPPSHSLTVTLLAARLPLADVRGSGCVRGCGDAYGRLSSPCPANPSTGRRPSSPDYPSSTGRGRAGTSSAGSAGRWP